jgi:hypothetical protein
MDIALISLLAGPMVAGFRVRQPKGSNATRELAALLARMHQRWYPETSPVLVSYWLKTVYCRGYELRWWKKLLAALRQAVAEEFASSAASRRALVELQTWIEQTVLSAGAPPQAESPRMEAARNHLDPERLAPYVARLLNEWLPVEVARLLVDESESPMWQEGGIPVLATAKALERLLVRERLSMRTLEMLLERGLLGPQLVYPADAEILRDVVLALLGRTEGPAPPVMPATLLAVAAESALAAGYSEAVRHASLVWRPSGEELHVRVGLSEIREILKSNQVQIGSIVVTMDGRWWESERLQYGENNFVVYRPKGRLRLDYSADHVKLRVPWPETRLRWNGEVSLGSALEIFGRQWHVSRWEQNGKRTWLDLVFSRVLPAIVGANAELRPARPASVDMAWAAVGNALASSIAQKSREPVEQLRHPDLIPVGRALFELSAPIMRLSHEARGTIETRLKAIRYLESGVLPVYGQVPWRIIPTPLRAALLMRGRSDAALRDLLSQVFEAFPEAPRPALGAGRVHAEAHRPAAPRSAA